MVGPPPEVAALSRALQDSMPPEVLFGVGGGAGFGRLVDGDQVTLLTRITTRETAKEAFLADICRNLQVSFELQVASSAEALKKRLSGALKEGRIPVVWVEPDQLPWEGPPAACCALAVLELDSRYSTVFDGEERRLATEALIEAAGTTGAKYRTLIVEGKPGDVGSAVRAGLQAHRQHMREGSGPAQNGPSVGLAGLARWAAQISSDTAAGATLAAQIDCRGGGPAMREAQSAFLAYAGHERAAAVASTAASRWSELSEALRAGYAGPDQVRAVHDAEADALAAVEATLRVS